MKVRIVSPGWETFTGPLGTGTMFEDGVSVGEVSHRAMMRIGCIVHLVEVLEDGSNGEQVGASSMMVNYRGDGMPVKPEIETGTQSAIRLQADADAADAAREAEALAAKEAAEKQATALQEARSKAEAEVPVVYTRDELEAIGANDGIPGLREIGDKINAKGRSITELVAAILKKQTEQLAS
jgi:hypothetical protein